MRASPIPIISSSSSLLSTLLLALAAITTAATTTLTLTVPPSPQLPHPHTLPASTHATLSTLSTTTSSTPLGSGGLHRARLDAADGFVFRNVTPGSYLADVHCAAYGFAPLRVDVDVNGDADVEAAVVRAWETFRGNDWANKGEQVREVKAAGAGGGRAGFPVRVLGPKVHYAERGSFSVFGILKNPMILMGLVSMALFVGLPKLVENMDPEMRAEWEEQQKKNPVASLGRFS